MLTTNFELEQEQYILSKEEEDCAMDNAIRSAKEYAVWKMKGLAYDDNQIAQKISEINWDEEVDRDAILKASNSNKVYELWQKENREKEKLEEERKKKELVEFWTAKNVYSLMKGVSFQVYGKEFILHDDNRKLITALCFFVSRDERFETELGFSFKKGLIIRGISGLGKTHLVQCIKDNGLNPIKILSMLEIADEMKQEGEFKIEMGNCKILYLDDVGTEEPTVNHFGTKINFFKTFIESVYLRNEGTGFGKLMLSTNNTFDEFEQKYGFRVRSRMRDMFNVLDIKGTDMRGNV